MSRLREDKLTIFNSAYMCGIALAVIAVSPDYVSADDCKVTDYIDHVEVECVGTPANNPVILPKPSPAQEAVVQESAGSAIQKQPAPDKDMSANGAQVSRRRQHIEGIRTLGLHRFDSSESQPSGSDFKK
jgi:hypothetical protein